MSQEQTSQDVSSLWRELAEASVEGTDPGFKEKVFPQVFQGQKLSRREQIEELLVSGILGCGCVMGILFTASLSARLVPFFEFLVLVLLVGIPAFLSVDAFLRRVAPFNPARLVLLALGLQFATPFWLAWVQAIPFRSYFGGFVSQVADEAFATYWFPSMSWMVLPMTVILVGSFIVTLKARDRAPWYDEQPVKKKQVLLSLSYFLAPVACYLFLLIVGQPSQEFASWKQEYSHSGRFGASFVRGDSEVPWQRYSRVSSRVKAGPERAEFIAQIEQLISDRDEKNDPGIHQFAALLELLLEEPEQLSEPDQVARQLLVTQACLGEDGGPSFNYFASRVEEHRTAAEFARTEESLSEALSQLPDAVEVTEIELMALSERNYYLDEYSLWNVLAGYGIDPWQLDRQRHVNALYRAWSELKAHVDRDKLNNMLADPAGVSKDSEAGNLLQAFLEQRGRMEGPPVSLVEPRKTRGAVEEYLVVSRLRLYQAEKGHYPESISEIELPDSDLRQWHLFRPYAGRPGPQIVKLKYVDVEGLDREWTLPK
ncbi:MAG: hypothetical protein KC800_22270 [Candidatus Eremiobacteraeota bacterium]|nr:hypothetical protein [Candidatus Eremiobacteraeota bacterium]